MKTHAKTITVAVAIVWFIINLISLVIDQPVFTIAIEPLATLIAYIAVRNFAFLPAVQRRIKQTLSYAFLLWIFVDIVSSIGELSTIFFHVDLDLVYNIEFILYFFVRALLLVSILQLYLYLTNKLNPFQKISDVATITICVICMSWLMFFDGEVDEFRGISFDLLRQHDVKAIFSLLYITLSLTILGVFLISWFQLQKYAMTIGQRVIMLCISGIVATDLTIALNNSWIDSVLLDTIYKFCITMFTIGCVYSDRFPLYLGSRHKQVENTQQLGTWKNAFYLLAYPVFTTAEIGFRISTICYFPIIAFYIVSCLYLKQITITDALLVSEKKYNEKLKLYSMVLEQAPLAIVITNVEGEIQYVNPYFTNLTGYTLDEVLGKNPRILKSNKTPYIVYNELWDYLTHGLAWEGEFINIDKTGEEFEEKAVIAPIKDDKGNITHYVALKENITENKRIKRQLSNQSYFTAQLLDTIPSSIFYLTVDDIFLGVNSEFEKQYEVQSKDLVGLTMSDIPWLSGNRYQVYLDMKNEVIHNNAPSIKLLNRQTEKNTIINILFSVSAFYLADGSIGGFLGIMTDVTELKQKEKELSTALLQANAATEAKSNFLANMSHEIRTPMNAVIGMSYLALKTNLDDKQRDYIQKIHSAATSLLGIINDILDFSKIESGKMELESLDFNLDTVITDSIGLLVEKAHEKQLEFLYHVPPDVPRHLIGDALRLGQIITNLVSNAVKFTENGFVSINIAEVERNANQICLQFSVKDTGMGLDQKTQDKLFESFMQSDNSTTRRFGGTGLGLAICKKLVEIMNGHIWVESELGKGSNFLFTSWFTLSEVQKLPETLSVRDIQQMNALISDDNSASREILQEYLTAMGFVVEAVSSGEDAVFLLMKKDKTSPFQILFIDWKMSELDGIQTIHKLSNLKLLEHMPHIVMITAYDKDEMVKQAAGLHVDAFLTKPISQSTLYDTIMTLFAQKTDVTTPPASLKEENYKLYGLNILLAEDNDVNQQIALELLSGQGIHVDIADNGMIAIEKAAEHLIDYDMILMDLQMPIVDGFEAAKQIRIILPDIPIIAMTARTMEEEREKCYMAGMNDHIPKPIDPDRLFSTIRKWIPTNRGYVTTSTQKAPIDSKSKQNAADNRTLEIEGVDTKAGLERVIGNRDLYTHLLQLFANTYSDTAAIMQQEFDHENYSAIVKLSHTLLGVSGNIGATGVQHLCQQIESMARSPQDLDSEMMMQLLTELKEETELVIHSILKVLNLSDHQKEESAVNEPSFDAVIDKLLYLLDEGDTEAVDYFNDTRFSLQKLLPEKEYQTIQRYIMNYEFDAAKSLLENLQ